MGILRRTVQREILDILDSSVFTSSDFTLEFGDHVNDENILTITFTYSDKFYYLIQKEDQIFDAHTYLVIKTPGELEENETLHFKNLKDTFEDIGQWCNEIRHELKAVQPIYEEVEKLKQIITEHISGDESEEFSVQEIYDIKEKFSILQERVEKLEKDKIITDKQLDEFQNGLNQVTDDIEHYPKKTWINTASNKLTNIITSIGKSKEGRKILADGAKKIIGIE